MLHCSCSSTYKQHQLSVHFLVGFALGKQEMENRDQLVGFGVSLKCYDPVAGGSFRWSARSTLAASSLRLKGLTT
jgi:hypothetical protein